ncbi:MAG: PH domain-containing protein [Planctomycetota bacterium]
MLLQGNLHPAVLILRLIDGLRQALFPLLFGVVVDRWFLVLAALLFLLTLGTGLARYLTFQYVLTDVELVTREGILNRQERRIPIDRVQDLGFESSILRRFLGLAVVRVETASGQGVEAQLDSLGRAEAEHLREVLLARRSREPAVAGAPRAPLAPEAEWRLHATPSAMLLLRGLTDLRLGAILVAGFGALELADQLGALAAIQGAGVDFYRWLSQWSLGIAAAVLVLLVMVVLAFSLAASAVGNLMVFHGFVLSLRADSLLCRYGLLTTRQKTLPRVRVQRVRIEQTWLRRLVGIAVVRADSAGSGRGTGDEAPGGYDVVMPMAPLPEIEPRLPALLPGLDDAAEPPRRASRLLVARVFLKGAVWVLLACAVLVPIAGPWGFLVLMLLPLPWLFGRLLWHNLAWALWQRHLYLRWGMLGRYQVLLPTAKVQAVAVHRSPLQRPLGLCDLSVFVAGGPPTRIPDLAWADAAPLMRALAARATAAAAGDWRGAGPGAEAPAPRV